VKSNWLLSAMSCAFAELLRFFVYAPSINRLNRSLDRGEIAARKGYYDKTCWFGFLSLDSDGIYSLRDSVNSNFRRSRQRERYASGNGFTDSARDLCYA